MVLGDLSYAETLPLLSGLTPEEAISVYSVFGGRPHSLMQVHIPDTEWVWRERHRGIILVPDCCFWNGEVGQDTRDLCSCPDPLLVQSRNGLA